MDTPCSGNKIKDKKKKKLFDKKHEWYDSAYGIRSCKHCDVTIYYT